MQGTEILLFNFLKLSKMKKLKLSRLDLGAAEVLSREELKMVLGGAGSGGGSGSCESGCADPGKQSTCDEGEICDKDYCSSTTYRYICVDNDAYQGS